MYRLAALALLATSVAAKGGCPSTSLTLEDWVSLIGMTPTREALCGDGLFAPSPLLGCLASAIQILLTLIESISPASFISPLFYFIIYFEFIWLPLLNECSDVLHLFLITY